MGFEYFVGRLSAHEDDLLEPDFLGAWSRWPLRMGTTPDLSAIPTNPRATRSERATITVGLCRSWHQSLLLGLRV